jgi:hypothetical protein
MFWPAQLAIILVGHAIAWRSVGAWSAAAARRALPRGFATLRHYRHQPPVEEQEPPAWLAPLARVVLVLALAALGLATLLDGGDGSQ